MEGPPLPLNMPTSIPPSNEMPIVHVSASKTVGEDIIPLSGNKVKASSTTPVMQTPVNQKVAKISKLSPSNHRCIKHYCFSKEEDIGQTTNYY